MKNADILRLRLLNLQISGNKFDEPAGLVAYLGAVQAQDYGAAKWALGLRLPGATDEEIENAFNEGSILRTHVMRPTWHFVAPQDIRWMQQLTGQRVKSLLTNYNSKIELDDAIVRKSNKAVVKALKGGNMLTRSELAAVLQAAGIATNEIRMIHLMMHAELDGIICSGPRKGKQFSYALLEERVPKAKSLHREEALAGLTSRYFNSHGPATTKDFAWWSGLTINDANAGLEMVRSELVHEVIDNKTYWFPASSKPAKTSPAAYLLPNYDEYIIAYKDRGAVHDNSRATPRGNVIFNNTIIIGGRVAGTWQRTFKKNVVEVAVSAFEKPGKAGEKAITKAAKNYGRFVGLPVKLT
jgi:winged helix DNA-binding protein